MSALLSRWFFRCVFLLAVSKKIYVNKNTQSEEFLVPSLLRCYQNILFDFKSWLVTATIDMIETLNVLDRQYWSCVVVVFALAGVLNLTTGLSQYQHVDVFRTSNVAGEIMTVRHKESGFSFYQLSLVSCGSFKLFSLDVTSIFFGNVLTGRKFQLQSPN